jgi:ABC-2 type transport system permease protein
MILGIAGRELRSLFLSPLAWILMSVSMLLLAWLFLVRLEEFIQLQPRLATLENAPGITAILVVPQFGSTAMILMLIVPILCMGLFARELSSGTFSLLLSSPVSVTQIVLGKYLAVLALLGILLLLILLMPLSLLMGGALDLGTLAACILGLVLLLAAYGAVGLYFSSLTRQPAVAAVSSYGALLLLWVLDLAGGGLFSYLGMSGHFQRLTSGLVFSSDMLYFLLITGLCLTLTVRRLDTLRTFG